MPCIIIEVGYDGSNRFTSRLDYHQAAARIADCISNKFGENGESGEVQERDQELGFLAVVSKDKKTGSTTERAYVLDWTYENIRFAFRETVDRYLQSYKIIEDANVLDAD